LQCIDGTITRHLGKINGKSVELTSNVFLFSAGVSRLPGRFYSYHYQFCADIPYPHNEGELLQSPLN